ncbi:MAG: WG repeat-containing protein [Bacteroidales bacterium]|jgi:hypothetical protein|nr:WG repeat-containing protein [Bacteroidales bacterium]
MKNVVRFWVLFASILFVQSIWAQSEVQVSGLKADEVWPVIRFVLKESNLGVATMDQQAGVLVTAPKEYSTALAKFRACVVFTYKNDNLVITMKNKQSATSTGWENSILPSKKADDKLVGGFADAIKGVIANPEQISKLKDSGAPAATTTKPVAGNQAVQTSALKPEPPKPSLANAKELRFDDEDNYTFSDGMCALKKNELWGFIDTTGKVVIDFTLFKLGNKIPKFSSGIALMANQESSGMRMPVFIDKKGQQLFKPQKFSAATPFENGIAIVEKTNEKTRMRTYSFINKQGQPIPGAIEPGSGRGLSLELKPFHEGVTPLYNNKASACGFINSQGKWVIPPTAYGETGDFGDGLVSVQNKVNWYWGYINKKGEVKVPFDYKKQPGVFSEGLAAVENSQEKVGFIDQNGKTVLPFIYEEGRSPFNNGHAIVYLKDKAPGYTIIDKSGNVVRKLGPDPIQVFDNGWIYYKEWHKKWAIGILSPDGKDILLPEYFTYIGEFANGLAYAVAIIDNKQVKGFINLNFDFVIIQTY